MLRMDPGFSRHSPTRTLFSPRYGTINFHILMKRTLFLIIAFLSCFGCNSRKSPLPVREVNLYVWSAYIPDRTLELFQKDTGINLNFSTYDSNEALLEKMESGLADYDVIVPSDYMVTILKRENLIRELDLKSIPNMRNISKRFQNPSYDPQNRYSVPFLWSTSGIGYNKSKVGKIDSWDVLWDPKYKNRILMLDDAREDFGVALKKLGYSSNSREPGPLLEAQKLLIQQKPLLKAYNSTNFDELLLAGDVWIAHAWSGNVAMVMQQNSNLDYVIPKEGAVLSVENFCVPVSATHLPEAYALINFMLDAKIGAQITNFSYYPNTNDAAKQYISPEILRNPAVYQDEESLARCEFARDIGQSSQLLDRLWTEIKSK
jgi:spermidine/putrescine-binding protein